MYYFNLFWLPAKLHSNQSKSLPHTPVHKTTNMQGKFAELTGHAMSGQHAEAKQIELVLIQVELCVRSGATQ